MSARVAIVTGRGRGIGRAIARGLEEAHGLRVIGTTRDELDVGSAEGIAAYAARLAKDGTGVDVLVNNAGIALDGFDADVVEKTLRVNFLGTMRLTDALVPLLREDARVVMVSSGMGQLSCLGEALQREVADPALTRERLVAFTDRFLDEVRAGTHRASGFPSSAYCVSKVAMNAYVRILARDLRQATDPRRILVNAACPGWVRTDMGGRGATRSVEEGARTPIWLATLPAGSTEPSGGFFRDEQPLAW